MSGAEFRGSSRSGIDSLGLYSVPGAAAHGLSVTDIVRTAAPLASIPRPNLGVGSDRSRFANVSLVGRNLRALATALQSRLIEKKRGEKMA
jgi:acyl dehydratase